MDFGFKPTGVIAELGLDIPFLPCYTALIIIIIIILDLYSAVRSELQKH